MEIIANFCSPAQNVNSPHASGQQLVFQNFQQTCNSVRIFELFKVFMARID
jgi:hypothetical protein